MIKQISYRKTKKNLELEKELRDKKNYISIENKYNVKIFVHKKNKDEYIEIVGK
jgi:hypothetical protein